MRKKRNVSILKVLFYWHDVWGSFMVQTLPQDLIVYVMSH